LLLYKADKKSRDALYLERGEEKEVNDTTSRLFENTTGIIKKYL
jgi:hypothetical protein